MTERHIIEALLLQSQDFVGDFKALMSIPEGQAILPELYALAPDDVVKVRRLHKDNLDHSIRVCGQVFKYHKNPSLRLLWAALYHDVGKAPTRRVTGSTVTFQGHETVGSRLVHHRLTHLGYDALFVEQVAKLVEVSGRISDVTEWTDSAVRRLAHDLDDDPALIEDALALVTNDCTSKHEKNHISARDRADSFRKLWLEVKSKDEIRALRPPIDGIRVMELLGIPPGRQVGVIMKFLLDNHLDSTPADAERAVKLKFEKFKVRKPYFL